LGHLRLGESTIDLRSTGVSGEGEKMSTEASSKKGEGSILTLMSRNLCLGADTIDVLRALVEGPEILIPAAKEVWGQAQATDFRQRVVALVDEIEEARPDLIGIQEGVEVAHLQPGWDQVTDFVLVMGEELERRSLPYFFLTSQENTSVTLPLGPGEELRFTDRLAVIVHRDFPYSGFRKGTYRATQMPGGGIEMRRGWIRVDAELDGAPYHFITTHLEIQPFAQAQALQAKELLKEVVGGLEGATVLLGDFNSNAAGSAGDPTWTSTYEEVLAAGFKDLWLLANPDGLDPGFTCCHDVDLKNPVPAFDQRIDFIFWRPSGWMDEGEPANGPGAFPGSLSVRTIGADPTKRTDPSGLWPSDHAGLVAELRLRSLQP